MLLFLKYLYVYLFVLACEDSLLKRCAAVVMAVLAQLMSRWLWQWIQSLWVGLDGAVFWCTGETWCWYICSRSYFFVLFLVSSLTYLQSKITNIYCCLIWLVNAYLPLSVVSTVLYLCLFIWPKILDNMMIYLKNVQDMKKIFCTM